MVSAASACAIAAAKDGGSVGVAGALCDELGKPAGRSGDDGRGTGRPHAEYRPATEQEMTEFEEHFDKRKVELGSCGRPYQTPCQHEHASIRCPMLQMNPKMLPRLDELEADLRQRRDRAVSEGWLGRSAAQRPSATALPAPGAVQGYAREAGRPRITKAPRHQKKRQLVEKKLEGDTAATEAPSELTIYRADAGHGRAILGLYTNREAARAHCEDYARGGQNDEPLVWYPDDADEAVEALSVAGVGLDTGFTVTAVTVASEYGGKTDE
ncbi:hypothetical protein GCM10023196_081100 [Actinoallomurus vinaceus]|uniref:Uncharacterized protein n=1 Tax=Actinoallomurus vinaceus TaxID=1080074 RepID=A0ABP8UN80_9ACTN